MPRRPSNLDPLYLSDSDIAARLGLGAAEWAATALILERSGLPRRDPLFRSQRCWWAVQDFLYRRAGGGARSEPPAEGGVKENLDALRPTRRRRTGIQE